MKDGISDSKRRLSLRKMLHDALLSPKSVEPRPNLIFESRILPRLHDLPTTAAYAFDNRFFTTGRARTHPDVRLPIGGFGRRRLSIEVFGDHIRHIGQRRVARVWHEVVRYFFSFLEETIASTFDDAGW